MSASFYPPLASIPCDFATGYRRLPGFRPGDNPEVISSPVGLVPTNGDYNLFLKAAHTVNLEDGRDPDARRTQFFREHLAELARAISGGANVCAYHAWSLLDDFEWADGYGQRYSLT